jgi:DNA-binding XRE family transcriptional regulator
MQSGIVPPSNDTKVRAPLPEIKDKIQETRSKYRITARQCRGARGLLGMSQRDLAVASGVHLQTLLDFEKGHRIPRGPTMQAIARALEDAGIVFIPANGGGQGVRLKEPESEPT